MRHGLIAVVAIVAGVIFAAASSHAAEPEFKVGLVMESREYEREKMSTGVSHEGL